MPDSPSEFQDPRPRRSWRRKFGGAFRGLAEGVCGQSSFAMHLAVAAGVAIAAAVMGMDVVRWAVLLLCMTVVLSAEMFNSALEAMARAVSSQSNPHLRSALDIASAAVLVAAMGAAAVGTLIFLHRLSELLG